MSEIEPYHEIAKVGDSPSKQPPIIHTKVLKFPSKLSRETKERDKTKRKISPRGQLITGVTMLHHTL